MTKLSDLNSTLGHITERITITSLYEIAAHRAMTKRIGDIMRISQPEQRPPESGSPGSTTQLESKTDLENQRSNWYGEVINFSLDGQFSVRLGGLVPVRKITCAVLDL